MQKEQEICTLLKEINSQLFKYAQEIYKPYGLTASQFAILLELMEEDHQNVSQLGMRLAMSKSNISAVLQRMETHGFITRLKSGEDQRSVCIALSEKGKQRIKQMKQTTCKGNTPFTTLSDEEQTQIVKGLRLLLTIVKESEKDE